MILEDFRIQIRLIVVLCLFIFEIGIFMYSNILYSFEKIYHEKISIITLYHYWLDMYKILLL